MNIYIKILVFGIIIILGLHACKSTVESSIEVEEAAGTNNDFIEITNKQFESSGFETSLLTKQAFSTTLEVTGNIHLANKYEQIVSSNVGGIINGLNIITGQWVKKGQVLFNISSTDILSLQQSYLELSSQLNYMEEEVVRQKLLADENISAKKTYIKAKADLQYLQAQLSGTRKKLELYGISSNSIRSDNFISQLQVKSKTSGYLTQINIKNGGYLNPGENAMEISSIYGMHLELLVLAKDINPLEVGQAVSFSVNSNPSKIYTSEINLIEKDVNKEGFIAVHCDISKEDKKALTPGMFVNADIELQSVFLPSLPSESFVKSDGKTYVLVQSMNDKNKYQKFEVKLEHTNNGYSSFTSINDIPENSIYLSKGSYFLITGD